LINNLIQISPSAGQAFWFVKYHTEKIPSAQERYINETKRILGVFETRLSEEGTNYIVGGKLTIADIAFYPWVKSVPFLGINLDTEFPLVSKWLKNLSERPSVTKAYADQQ
jgi:glutathione S-transferase